MNIEGPFNKWVTRWNADESTAVKIRMLSVALNYQLAFIARRQAGIGQAFAVMVFIRF